jgi:Putative bacterial sensory transduction regulator
MLLLKSTFLLGLAVSSAAPAAQLVRAQDPQSVVAAMQAAGYSATLATDGTGDPMIKSAASGSTFHVFFYNCTDHKACATVQFHSGYHLTNNPSLTAINEWNKGQRFGRAFLDKDNDPILEMDVDLDDGGLSPLLFADNLEFWTSLLGSFEKEIGYRD